MVLPYRRSTVSKSCCRLTQKLVGRRQAGYREQVTEDRWQMAAGRFFCHLSSAICHPFSSAGSVLVMVLWILILVSFLAGQYLAHNREKADIARNAWAAFRQRQAVISMIQLFSTDAWPIPEGTGADGRWFRLFPDDADVWIRVDKESSRVNLNTASEGEIKQKLAKSMDDSRQRESDEISDAILDWRDEDSLTRLHGAEENAYKAQGVSYRPANGPFNTMSEMLLVKGVTQDFFWGDPIKVIETDLDRRYVRSEEESDPKALSEIATIYAASTKRISLLVPGEENGYLFMNIFTAKEAGRLKVVGSQETLRVAEKGFDRLVELESEVLGLEARGKKRR